MTNRVQHTEKKVTEKQARTTAACSATSSSTTTATQPGVFWLAPHELEQIRQAYAGLLGDLNLYKAQVIEEAVKNGVEASAILDAIEQTAYAPRPSHAYFSAILRRYIASQITTAKKAEDERQERLRRRWKANRGDWSAWYDRPEDLDELPF